MLRIGILGGATIVPRFVEGVRLSGAAEVVGLARRNVESAKKLAKQLNIAEVFENYETLVNSKNIDLVYIPLINSAHFSAAKMALQAGKSVLLEKPFTLTTHEALALFELAKSRHLFLMEAQKAVFLPVLHQVKQVLEAGKIGALQHIEIKESRAGVEKIPWFHDLAAGGGTLISNASYPLSVLQYLLGTGFDATTGFHKAPAPDKADYEIQLLLEKNELLISLFISSLMDFQSQMILHGKLGKIVIPDYWKTQTAEILMKDGSHEEINYPHDSEFIYEIQHVAKCLEQGLVESPLMPWAHTLENVHVVENSYQNWYGPKWPNL